MLLVRLDALGEATVLLRAARHRHHIGQQHGEGLVADDVTRAPDRVAETEWRLLTGEARGASGRQIGHQRLVFLHLSALLQRVLELVGHVEMVFDHALVAPGHEDEVLDACLAGLVDDVLQHGPVDDRQHLLRHGFRRRQKAGAESGDRENCLADASRHGNLELSSDRVRGLRYEGSFGVEVNATPVEHSSARSVRAATPR